MIGRTTPIVVAGSLVAALAATAAGQSALLAVGSGVGDGSANLYEIIQYATTPAAVDLGETGIQLADLAVHPTTGVTYVVDFAMVGTSQLYRLDTATTQLFAIGPLGASSQNALEFDLQGNLYSWGYADTNLYRVNLQTGAASVVGSVGALSAGDLAFDLDGTLWGASDSDTLVRIDPETGTAVTIGPFGVLDMYGIEVDSAGVLYGFGGTNTGSTADVYTVNRKIGAATHVAQIANAGNLGLWGVSFVKSCGFQSYGDPAPAQSLVATWRPGNATTFTQGTFLAAGAHPSTSGLVALSLAPAALVVGPNTVLVDLAPGKLALLTGVPFDAQGRFTLPLSASVPAIAGLPLFTQVFEASPVAPTSSNGLQMVFCP